MQFRHGISLCIGAFLAFIFAWLFIQGADWSSIRKISSHVSFGFLILVLLPLGAGYAARIWRWHFLLKKYNNDLSISACLTPYFSAFALNNLLPFRLGDIARITLFTQQLKINYAAITSSLLIERIVDFVTLLLLFSVSTFFISVSLPQSNPILEYIFIVATSVMTGIFLFLLFPAYITRFLMQLDSYFTNKHLKTFSKATHFLREISNGIYIHSNRQSLLILFASSLCIWLSEAMIFWLVAHSFHFRQDGASSIFVMGLSTFSTLLPSTPGYIGTFHYLCRQSLEWTGTDPDLAIAYAILIHLVIVLPVTLTGTFTFVYYFGAHWKNRLRKVWGSA